MCSTKVYAIYYFSYFILLRHLNKNSLIKMGRLTTAEKIDTIFFHGESRRNVHEAFNLYALRYPERNVHRLHFIEL